MASDQAPGKPARSTAAQSRRPTAATWRFARQLASVAFILLMGAAALALATLVGVAASRRSRTEPFVTPPKDLLRWRGEPAEPSTVFQGPSIGPDLRGVAITPGGRHGWAVGTDGTIGATADGGATWRAQSS
ncbi:MAG: Photosynthesis system assembly factor, partial [Myxococcaceae bacterium]|nr:Photosynthesis system assembly factor [Myxococcaceae bacterium]